MSATKETIITCDGGSNECLSIFGNGDRRNETATQQRKAMKGTGWIHQCGEDYCEPCWKLVKAAGCHKGKVR